MTKLRRLGDAPQGILDADPSQTLALLIDFKNLTAYL